jgi:hypothetical protein
MVKTLERAIAEIATLPEAAQEEIGRGLLAHVENVRKLRSQLEEAARELDAGEGRELNIENFLTRLHQGYAKA